MQSRDMLSINQARSWYEQADRVHDFDHVVRVSKIAEILAEKEGADQEIVRAAALLHDARGSSPNEDESRAGHHLASAEFAYGVLDEKGWSNDRIEAVQHCIRAHRFRSTEKPKSIEAKVVFDADKLDVLGAIGAARTIAYAVLAEQPIFAEPSNQFLRTGDREPREPHSSYHEFLYKLVRVKERLCTQSAKSMAEGRHKFLVIFYEQLASEVRGER
jgi:uncharacterized protein